MEGASALTDLEGLSEITAKEEVLENVRKEGLSENVLKEEALENVRKEGTSVLTDQEGLSEITAKEEVSQEEENRHSEVRGIQQRVHSTRRI